MKGSNPNLAGFFEGDARLFEFVGSVYVRVFSGLAATLRFSVDKNCRTTFGHEEDDRLGDGAEDELDPEEPLPIEDYLKYC